MTERPTCPECGDRLGILLANSTLCEFCYRAAVFGGTSQAWKNERVAYLKACDEITAKLKAERGQ